MRESTIAEHFDDIPQWILEWFCEVLSIHPDLPVSTFRRWVHEGRVKDSCTCSYGGLHEPRNRMCSAYDLTKDNDNE